jgi:FlaA1/EpsC-like NDP-sugar epimerase
MKFEFTKNIISLHRYSKRIITIISDSALCVLCTWLAFWLRLEELILLKDFNFIPVVISISLALPIFWLFGLYRTIFRYSGLSIIFTILSSITIYGLLYFLVIGVYGIKGVPRSIGIIQPMLLFFSIISLRLFVKYILTVNKNTKDKFISKKKVLIYGAGSAGNQLATTLESSNEFKLVGFLDDNHQLHNRVILGKSIYSPSKLESLIETRDIKIVLLALPSISRKKRNSIIENLKKHRLIVKTLPSLEDIVDGKITFSDIKDLSIDDLLDREEVTPDLNLLTKNVKSQTVLVTGAGGSIGGEICRQILKINPKKIILVDLSEYALYSIQSDLEEMRMKLKINNQLNVIPILASIQNKDVIFKIINFYKPNTIYHAAAYKHVPLVEQNIFEGIRNNVFGTLHLLNSAIENNVSNFVLISTDKAVRPTSIMGASKRLSELILQSIYHKRKNNLKTKFTIVRFGNVLDSSGSVIPKFRKQISEGGPITLTHFEVSRYFMTIPEAAQLVIQSSALSEGCDIYILDMGKLIKIKDLIYKLTRLSGLTIRDYDNPDGDIEISEIGLRPGEKLYEELLLGDQPQATSHSKIKKVNDPYIEWDLLESQLKEIDSNITNNKISNLVSILEKLVSGYNPSKETIDSIKNTL